MLTKQLQKKNNDNKHKLENIKKGIKHKAEEKAKKEK